jgi:3-hydroxyacyl-CoA dehydrogenase/enoyl-CoA hydratase/3-hydroxybutyryl-CoA epimerase
VTLLQTKNLHVDDKPEGVRLLWFDVAGRAVNVLTADVLDDLEKAIDRVAADEAARLLVLRSEKRSGFIAGADLHEFTAIRTADEARAVSASGQRVFTKLAGLRVPTIALIHGPCLGGGLEVALACDYRLLLDHPKTQLGLPEVELGLLPAWGGCQRLPRVIGLERALQVILAGRRLGAQEALRWGLADAIGATEPELAARLSLLMVEALRRGKRPKKRLPMRTWRQRVLEWTWFNRRLIFRSSERLLQRRVPDDMPAPFEALRAVQVGVNQGIEAGFAAEQEAAGRLVMSRACQNLVNLFLQREEARKLPERMGAASKKEIKRVAVIGAGTMGAGIAQLAAIRGCEVIVREIDQAALAAGMTRIAGLFHKAVQNGIAAGDAAEKMLASIKPTTQWQGFNSVDLAIEAVVEDLEIKQRLVRDLEENTGADTILCTNTSSLLVGQLQRSMKRPDHLGGLHFFNPVHKMPLVEVIRGTGTSDDVIAGLCRWAAALGKTPVVVKDSPGFVVNRILMPYMAEAVLLVSQGVAADGIDHSMRRFGMPMGPLELLDQVGLDVAAHIARALRPVFAQRWQGEPRLQQLAETFEQLQKHGWLGQKAGAGFYVYKGKTRKLHHAAIRLLTSTSGRDAGESLGGLSRGMQVSQARERLVLLMVNEAASCLAEGLADATAIDLAMVLGTGWAPHRGGPLRYANDRGRVEVVKALEALAQHLGPRFEPSAGLRTWAAQAQTVRA